MYAVVNAGLLTSIAPGNGTVKTGHAFNPVRVPHDQPTARTVAGDLASRKRQSMEYLQQAIDARRGTFMVIVDLAGTCEFAGIMTVDTLVFQRLRLDRTVGIDDLTGDGWPLAIVTNAHVGT
jgi:hypothetical protein